MDIFVRRGHNFAYHASQGFRARRLDSDLNLFLPSPLSLTARFCSMPRCHMCGMFISRSGKNI